MTRIALTKIQLGGKKAQAEMNEELDRLKTAKIPKIPLKYPTKNNHSK